MEKTNSAPCLVTATDRKRKHNLREAEQTLQFIINIIEKGYTFSDSDAPAYVRELKKIVQTLNSEVNLLAEPIDSLNGR